MGILDWLRGKKQANVTEGKRNKVCPTVAEDKPYTQPSGPHITVAEAIAKIAVEFSVPKEQQTKEQRQQNLVKILETTVVCQRCSTTFVLGKSVATGENPKYLIAGPVINLVSASRNG